MKFQVALASAVKGDVEGTFFLMQCFLRGIGCKKNERVAKELLKRCADLGSVSAFYLLFKDPRLEPFEMVRCFGFFGMFFFGSNALLSALDAVLERHAMDDSFGDAILFEVGEMFKGNLDVEKEKVFREAQLPSVINTLSRVVSMYDGWCDAARDACVAWVLTGKRIGLNKDVRRMIARMVWESRREGRQVGVPRDLFETDGK